MKYKLNKIAYFMCAIILNITSITGFSASTGRAGAGGGGGGGGPLADMELSNGGAAFLHRVEGFRADRYLDTKGNPTIGYGHLITIPDPELTALGYNPTAAGLKITKLDAQQLFLSDVQSKADISRYINCELTQSQFDALTSFCYNIGYGNFGGCGGKTPKKPCNTLQDIRAGRIMEAADHMVTWNRADPGIVKRHFAEVSIYTDTEFDSDWREISSHIGIRMPACDAGWATLRRDLREEVVKLYKEYDSKR